MHKEIEKAKLRIARAIEKNREAYEEARGNYHDTGYDRYWKKMKKLEAERDELEEFLEKERATERPLPDTVEKLNDLQMNVANIKSKWDCLKVGLPESADVIGIDDIFMDIKSLLN